METEMVYACRICGTKRQRNLILSYAKKSDQTFEEFILGVSPCEIHAICLRCSSLNLTNDDIRYMRDRYFPADMRRYLNTARRYPCGSSDRPPGPIYLREPYLGKSPHGCSLWPSPERWRYYGCPGNGAGNIRDPWRWCRWRFRAR